jgi:hypothetical protein
MQSIDMDASANETNQHIELKDIVDSYLIDLISDKLHQTFDGILTPRLVS